MHILLIGATGRTGQLILTHLLSRSHAVTVLVRDPSALASRSNLTVVQGTPLSPASVSQAFTRSGTPIDAVVVALGSPIATPFSKPTAPPRLMADSHKNLVAAMRQHGVRRIVTMSAFGIGSSRPNVNWMLNLLLRKTSMAAQFEDHDRVDEEMRAAKGVDWTGVRSVMLVEGQAAEVRDLGDEGKGSRAFEKVSRESVVRFIVEKCVEEGKFLGRCPVIAN